ncbi:MAG TPA: TIGR01777 family oxidoreductase [Planctomycetota bacterium]|jgi:hypothetical protein|nr:TIGR01777 family oxidoreductase [Planctomycetota bacterium]
MATSVFRIALPVSAAELNEWHARPGAFARLASPWQRIEVLEAARTLDPGARARVRLHVGPFPVEWVAEHVEHVPGIRFRDVARSGPFERFDHTHTFGPGGEGRSVLEDRIEWELPFGRVGRLAEPFARRELARTFAYRHRITAWDLACHARWPVSRKKWRVLVTGAHGLIGSALVPFLTAGGHEVVTLSLRGPFEPALGEEPFDAVVHLAGEPIASGRWTAAKRERILMSRVDGTRALCEYLARRRVKPSVLISASAVGFYGDHADEVLDEPILAGSGFLADVCREWEAATRVASEAGIRVVNLRLGVVLSASGGALRKLLMPFQLGLGGRIGSGRQYMSWIALDDLLGVVAHLLDDESVKGPVNAVAPNPVTNADFTATLARVLRRPALLPLPATVARAAFGEVADELLLASQRVIPKRLLETGHHFGWPSLEAALRHVLGRIDSPAESGRPPPGNDERRPALTADRRAP